MVHLRELKYDDASCSSSYFQKTVMLSDWWLIKCPDEFKGKRFGVAGTELMASIERRALRVFTSAPIVKAVDVWTLETSDGICIHLKGLINKERTVKGGFSHEIFRHFIFGFPPRWEEISNECFKGDSSSEVEIDAVSLRIDTVDCPIKNKENPPESKSKTSTSEINTAEAYGEGTNDDSGSHELKPVTNSGDKSRKTQTCPVTEKDVKFERNTARQSLRLQLKAGGNSTDNERKNYTAKVLNPSDCEEDSDSFSTPVMERSNGFLNNAKAKTVDAEKDGIVDDVVSSEVDTTVKGKPSASQVDGFGERDSDPINANKTRNCVTKESRILRQHRVEHEAISIFGGKKEKAVKCKGKVKPYDSKGKIEDKEKEGLSGSRTKRMINPDLEATPDKQARKQNTDFVSPESLSTKRSRSGRLLVSTLEFWRNQVPVYDADRKLIGIKERTDATMPITGKGSESERRRRIG